jgi:hypothetical protein
MLKRIWSFTIDFWRDGNVLLGAVAAPLSIAFTLAKAFDVEALGHLRDISYAWALAPLTLWFFIAYVRNRARNAKSGRKTDLQDFYVSVGPILTRSLPKDMPEVDFEKYVSEADLWVNSCASYIDQEMGIAARERFLDRTGTMAAHYSGAINERHNMVIQNLTTFRKNLLVLIESGSWG